MKVQQSRIYEVRNHFEDKKEKALCSERRRIAVGDVGGIFNSQLGRLKEGNLNTQRQLHLATAEHFQ